MDVIMLHLFSISLMGALLWASLQSNVVKGTRRSANSHAGIVPIAKEKPR